MDASAKWLGFRCVSCFLLTGIYLSCAHLEKGSWSTCVPLDRPFCLVCLGCAFFSISPRACRLPLGMMCQMLGAQGVDKSDVDFWALHPGGHRIVEVSATRPPPRRWRGSRSVALLAGVAVSLSCLVALAGRGSTLSIFLSF